MGKIFFVALAAAGLMYEFAAAEIRNGYETDIRDARLTHSNLCRILKNNQNDDPSIREKLTPQNRKKIRSKIEEMKKLIDYFELTEKLLEEFRVIAPELYHQIDTLRNAKGIITDVYVRFMISNDIYLSSKGCTELDPCAKDQHACKTVFGKHTVSVSVCAGQQALCTLAHELGHVLYLVPHISTYITYYKKRYKKDYFNSRCIGHHPDDPCGKMAESFQERFGQYYRKYKKNKGATDGQMVNGR